MGMTIQETMQKIHDVSEKLNSIQMLPRRRSFLAAN